MQDRSLPARRNHLQRTAGPYIGSGAVSDRSSLITRLEAVRVLDMSSSNLWAELAATYVRTRSAYG
jgi:hypothetical protein